MFKSKEKMKEEFNKNFNPEKYMYDPDDLVENYIDGFDNLRGILFDIKWNLKNIKEENKYTIEHIKKFLEDLKV